MRDIQRYDICVISKFLHLERIEIFSSSKFLSELKKMNR